MKAVSMHFVCRKNKKREKKKDEKSNQKKKENVFLGLETFFLFLLAFLICKRCKFGVHCG